MFSFIRKLFYPLVPLEGALFPPLQLPLTFRQYQASDFDACIAICRNVEINRFPPDALELFAKYLKSEAKTFIVAELNAEIVGFGGIARNKKNTANLVFGMVAKKYQRQRIGTTLVLLRISLLRAVRLGNWVTIMAVKDSFSIYRRFGFRFWKYWKSKDGNLHPAGFLVVSNETLLVIQTTLKTRGICIQGEFNLPKHESPKIPPG